jgi:hypothetical protein
MNIKQKNVVFIANQNSPGRFSIKLKGDNQPPKKRTTVKLDINIMLQYSPKKNKAKPIEEYSTLNPATSSASASGKSKGDLLVSASVDTKKIKVRGKR